MTKKNTTSDQKDLTAEPKLEHWYGHIGISAVVAALRFVTCSKYKGSESNSSEREEALRHDMAA
jgi:hypothetical protein